MNPNSDKLPLQLPVPIEHSTSALVQEKSTSTEVISPGSEKAAASMPAAVPTTIPLPTPPSIPSMSQTSTTDSNATHGNPVLASDDTNLIEKEWVNKAKQIIEQTRDNPYQQSDELTIFKADYIKKRYNRAIKLK